MRKPVKRPTMVWGLAAKPPNQHWSLVIGHLEFGVWGQSHLTSIRDLLNLPEGTILPSRTGDHEELFMDPNITLTLSDLQAQVLQRPMSDRWVLLRLLIESLQPACLPLSDSAVAHQSLSLMTNPHHPLSQYYGCIDDETFVRHPQPEQPERTPLS